MLDIINNSLYIHSVSKYISFQMFVKKRFLTTLLNKGEKNERRKWDMGR
jgi:hypothetical protein